MLKLEPDFPIEEHFDILIPIDFSIDENDKFTVTAYEHFKEFAQSFIDKFSPDAGGDPFGEEAMEWLYKESAHELKRLGYKADVKRKNVWVRNYELCSSDKINKSLIQPDSQKLDLTQEYKNLTTFDLSERFDMELCACATLAEGKIVSIAAENTHFDDDGTTEISVETNPSYRNKGYAKSNVALLSMELLKEYSKVIYKCGRNNVKSQAIAEAVGFSFKGRSFYLCAYEI